MNLRWPHIHWYVQSGCWATTQQTWRSTINLFPTLIWQTGPSCPQPDTKWRCQGMRSKLSQTWASSTFIRTYPRPQRVRFTDCGAKVFPVLVSATSTQLLLPLQCFGRSCGLIRSNTKKYEDSVVESPKSCHTKVALIWFCNLECVPPDSFAWESWKSCVESTERGIYVVCFTSTFSPAILRKSEIPFWSDGSVSSHNC